MKPKKLKFDPSVVYQVQLDMFTKAGWLKTLKKVKDSKCQVCKKVYADMDDETLAFAIIRDGKTGNIHLCNECGQMYIDLGSIDIKKQREENSNNKEKLIVDILKWNSRYKRSGAYFSSYNLESKNLDELKEIHKKEETKVLNEIRIQEEIKSNYIDTPTEQYLFDDYDLYEDTNYLRHPKQIISLFKNIGREYFECGQGFYQDDHNLICKIGDKFYNVTITAEICSAKQDVGDRLYWVDGIEKVTYQSIDKPLPKDRKSFSFTIENCTEIEFSSVKYFLNENNIKFK